MKLQLTWRNAHTLLVLAVLLLLFRKELFTLVADNERLSM